MTRSGPRSSKYTSASTPDASSYSRREFHRVYAVDRHVGGLEAIREDSGLQLFDPRGALVELHLYDVGEAAID
jgi:hypothetical protein